MAKKVRAVVRLNQGGQFNFVAQMMPREQLKAMFGAMRPGKKG